MYFVVGGILDYVADERDEKDFWLWGQRSEAKLCHKTRACLGLMQACEQHDLRQAALFYTI